jgi:hypothetical protein
VLDHNAWEGSHTDSKPHWGPSEHARARVWRRPLVVGGSGPPPRGRAGSFGRLFGGFAVTSVKLRLETSRKRVLSVTCLQVPAERAVGSATGARCSPKKLALLRSDQDASPETLGASAHFISIECIARPHAAACGCPACDQAAPRVPYPDGSQPPHKLALLRSHQEAPHQPAGAHVHANLVDRIKRPR